MLSPLVDLFRIEGSKVRRVAIVCDVRGGEYFAELERVLDELGAAGVEYSLVFLEASDDVLVARFKETRRRHPLAAHDSVLDGIKRERELLDALRERANHIIDTSGITIQELKLWLNEEIIHRGQRQSITFSFVSFGYKYGIPIDADLLFDVRFLPNPFYDLDLRPLSGLDQEVRDYVLEVGRRRRVLRRAAAAARLPVPALCGRGQGAPDDRHRLHRGAPPLGDHRHLAGRPLRGRGLPDDGAPSRHEQGLTPGSAVAPRRSRPPRLQWLYPGLGMKRRVLAVVRRRRAGRHGGVVRARRRWSRAAGATTSAAPGSRGTCRVALLLAAACLHAGLVVLVLGTRSLYRFARAAGEPGVVAMRSDVRLARGPRIVAIGGGTGQSVLLSGLKEHSEQPHRRRHGRRRRRQLRAAAPRPGRAAARRHPQLPRRPGRRRVAHEPPVPVPVSRRRAGCRGTASATSSWPPSPTVTGDFERAVQESTSVLNVRGRVLPATLESVTLRAELQGGAAGRRRDRRSRRASACRCASGSNPAGRGPCRQALEAIAAADLVVLGPGSVYTSIVPNLLIPEVRDALKHTRARVVYVCNVMTQPGETDGYSAADHLRALSRHGAAGMIDDVLVNDTPVSAELAAVYRAGGAAPVAVDDRELGRSGVRVVHARLAHEGDFFRHDSGEPRRRRAAPGSDAVTR